MGKEVVANQTEIKNENQIQVESAETNQTEIKNENQIQVEPTIANPNQREITNKIQGQEQGQEQKEPFPRFKLTETKPRNYEELQLNTFMLTDDLEKGIISSGMQGAKPVNTYEDLKKYLMQLSKAYRAIDTQTTKMINLPDGTSYPVNVLKISYDENGRAHQHPTNPEVYARVTDLYLCIRRVLKTVVVPKDKVEEYKAAFKLAFNRESKYKVDGNGLDVDYPPNISNVVYNHFYNMKNIFAFLDAFADKKRADDIIAKAYKEFKTKESFRIKRSIEEENAVRDEVKIIEKYPQPNRVNIKRDEPASPEEAAEKKEREKKFYIYEEARLLGLKEKAYNDKIATMSYKERDEFFRIKWAAKRNPALRFDITKYELIDTALYGAEKSEKLAKEFNTTFAQERNSRLYNVNEYAIEEYKEFNENPQEAIDEDEIENFKRQIVKNNFDNFTDAFGIEKDSFSYKYLAKYFEPYFNPKSSDAETIKRMMVEDITTEITNQTYREIFGFYPNSPNHNVKTISELRQESTEYVKKLTKQRTALTKQIERIEKSIKEPNYEEITKFEPNNIYLEPCETEEREYAELGTFIGNRFDDAVNNENNKYSSTMRLARMLDTYNFLRQRHQSRGFFNWLFNFRKYGRETAQLQTMKRQLLANPDLKEYVAEKDIDKSAVVSAALGKLQAKIDFDIVKKPIIEEKERLEREYKAILKIDGTEKPYIKNYNAQLDEELKTLNELDLKKDLVEKRVKFELTKQNKVIKLLGNLIERSIQSLKEELIENKRLELRGKISFSENKGVKILKRFEERNDARGITNLGVIYEEEPYKDKIKSTSEDDEIESEEEENLSEEIQNEEREEINPENVKEVAEEKEIDPEDIDNDQEDMEKDVKFNPDEITPETETEDELDLEGEFEHIETDNYDYLEEESVEYEEPPLDESLIEDLQVKVIAKAETEQKKQKKVDLEEENVNKSASVMEITMVGGKAEELMNARMKNDLNQTMVGPSLLPKKRKEDNEKANDEENEKEENVENEENAEEKKTKRRKVPIVVKFTAAVDVSESQTAMYENEFDLSSTTGKQLVDMGSEFEEDGIEEEEIDPSKINLAAEIEASEEKVVESNSTTTSKTIVNMDNDFVDNTEEEKEIDSQAINLKEGIEVSGNVQLETDDIKFTDRK